MTAAERAAARTLAAGLALATGRVSFDSFVVEAGAEGWRPGEGHAPYTIGSLPEFRPPAMALGHGWVNGWDHTPEAGHPNPIPESRQDLTAEEAPGQLRMAV